MKLNLSHKLVVSLINLVSKTWRINVIGDIPEMPAIIIFWHGLMLPGWKIFSDKSPYAVVSQSKDGEILSALLKKWGFKLIRGSSSKSGKEVLAEITLNAQDNYLLMTPDGPRGPINKMKPGALIASLRTGTPLYLCGIKINSKITFDRSWDKFQLPLPFSKIEITYSQPFILSKELSREEISKKIEELEKELNDLSFMSVIPANAGISL